jgi:hypothetical protein
MNPDYKALQQQADQLHYRCRDLVSGSNADQIANIAQDVREDLERGMTPRQVEARILVVMKQLSGLMGQPNQTMKPQDARMMVDAYERLRRQVRELPNY